MIGKAQKNHVIIETAPASIEGEDLAATSEIVRSGEGESLWVDFESDFTFSGEDDASLGEVSSKKSRESMLAETVALARKLSVQKKNRPFQVVEEDFIEDEDDFAGEDIFLPGKHEENRPLKSTIISTGTEKNSEAMAGGCFFGTIGLSLACLLFSFFMLGMPHFPGILGFVFFELVAVLLIFSSREFLKGWGHPERAFRMGMMGGFLSWEVLIILFWSMFVTALWQDHTLYLLADREASAILIALVGGVGVFGMSFFFLRLIEWARDARFMVGKSGLIFISLASAVASGAIANLLLFL